MFDPDGDQAAADSTRSSTSLDTGWSLNPRTARRLVTASYTSIIASLPPAICFVQTHASSSSAKLIKSQYSQGPGTQRKTSPSTATWQTDGNDRCVATSDSRFAASSRKRLTRTRAASSGSCSKPLYQSGCSNPTWNTASPANVSRSPPDARRTTLCPGVWPPVRWTTTPGATSYSLSNGRSWLWYSFKNRLAADRSASGNPGGMETREKSGAAQNLTSSAATWTRRSLRSRSLTPSTSSPPTWSMCMWVSTTSVTDERSMPASSSRWTKCPARGKFKSGSDPSPASTRMVRSPLRTRTTF